MARTSRPTRRGLEEKGVSNQFAAHAHRIIQAECAGLSPGIFPPSKDLRARFGSSGRLMLGYSLARYPTPICSPPVFVRLVPALGNHQSRFGGINHASAVISRRGYGAGGAGCALGPCPAEFRTECRPGTPGSELPGAGKLLFFISDSRVDTDRRKGSVAIADEAGGRKPVRAHRR